jgi:hypothetical protein
LAKTKVLDLSLLRFELGLELKARLSRREVKNKAIQEDGAEFTLQFEDGSSVTIQLGRPRFVRGGS